MGTKIIEIEVDELPNGTDVDENGNEFTVFANFPRTPFPPVVLKNEFKSGKHYITVPDEEK